MILFLLICIGIGVYVKVDPTAGGQVMTLSFGALLALTKATKSNREQVNGDGEEATPSPPTPATPATPTTAVPAVALPDNAMRDGGSVQLGKQP